MCYKLISYNIKSYRYKWNVKMFLKTLTACFVFLYYPILLYMLVNSISRNKWMIWFDLIWYIRSLLAIIVYIYGLYIDPRIAKKSGASRLQRHAQLHTRSSPFVNVVRSRRGNPTFAKCLGPIATLDKTACVVLLLYNYRQYVNLD